jgi:hypothetical protein
MFGQDDSLHVLDDYTSQNPCAPIWDITSNPYIMLQSKKKSIADLSFITEFSNNTYPSNYYVSNFLVPSLEQQSSSQTATPYFPPVVSVTNTALMNTSTAAMEKNPRISELNQYLYYDYSAQIFSGLYKIEVNYTNADFILDMTNTVFSNNWGFKPLIKDGSATVLDYNQLSTYWLEQDARLKIYVDPSGQYGLNYDVVGVSGNTFYCDASFAGTYQTVLTQWNDISFASWFYDDLCGNKKRVIDNSGLLHIANIDLSSSTVKHGSVQKSLTMTPFTILINQMNPIYDISFTFYNTILDLTGSYDFNSVMCPSGQNILDSSLNKLISSQLSSDASYINMYFYYDAAYTPSGGNYYYTPSMAPIIGVVDISISYTPGDFFLDLSGSPFFSTYCPSDNNKIQAPAKIKFPVPFGITVSGEQMLSLRSYPGTCASLDEPRDCE